MITVTGLKKVFKLNRRQMKSQGAGDKERWALQGVDFDVAPGEIFGLLGPNGAGKTTTLRCISTLIRPTSGDVIIEGVSVTTDPSLIRGRIAFLTNELKLDGHFTPDFTMEHFGKLYNLDSETIAVNKERLFTAFGISEFRHVRINGLSTGMKQKLSIAVSLIHDPEIIIFDEPTNGLDIITAKAVTDYLLGLKNRGKTILLSTHIMSVAAKLCDRIAVIINGRVIRIGTHDEILRDTGASDLEEAFFMDYVKAMQGGEADV